MTDIYVIMGDSNSRKSSTIRALTGVARKRSYDISTTNGIIETYISISSLQESKTSPKAFLKEVNSMGCKNVLVSLWIRNGKSLPKGRKYLDKFTKSGWNIKPIAVLGSTLPNLPQRYSVKSIKSKKRPSNEIASEVRKMWNWL